MDIGLIIAIGCGVFGISIVLFLSIGCIIVSQQEYKKECSEYIAFDAYMKKREKKIKKLSKKKRQKFYQDWERGRLEISYNYTPTI